MLNGVVVGTVVVVRRSPTIATMSDRFTMELPSSSSADGDRLGPRAA
jgi:hypothetical protein